MYHQSANPSDQCSYHAPWLKCEKRVSKLKSMHVARIKRNDPSGYDRIEAKGEKLSVEDQCLKRTDES